MTLTEQVLTIAIAVIATMATRFLPFFIFPGDKPTPKFIQYLGNNLPPAILGILVIYCYKEQITHPDHLTLLAVIAGLITVGMQWWKQNMLLSILLGTITYIVMV